MDIVPVQEWEEPPRIPIFIEWAAFIAALTAGGLGLARHRRKLLLPWFACVTSWFTLCKYVICTHCEHHGEFCEFYGLGKHAARMFPKKRKNELSPFGWATEAVSAGGMTLLPLLAVKENSRELALYAMLVLAQGATMLHVSCRRCALTATDPWKNVCPGYHIARFLYVDR